MTLRLHCDKCPANIVLSKRDAVPADWSKIKMTSGSNQQLMHLCPSCTWDYSHGTKPPITIESDEPMKVKFREGYPSRMRRVK